MLHRRTFTLFVVICLGHVLLISAQVQSKSGLPVLHSLAFGAFAGFQSVTSGVADTGRGIWSHYVALSWAARENEALRQRVLDLEGALQAQQARLADIQALEATLGLRERVGGRTLPARVIAGSPTPGSDRVAIDQGARDGIRPDLAVINGEGVVGRVIGPVSAHAATVQLLIGQTAAAAVVLGGSQAGGILRGGAANGTLFRVDYVPTLADVRPGEPVTSSGQDGIYPPGYPVGTVERVEGAGTADRQILVRPAVDFSHLNLVLVILPGTPDTESGGS
jgi:rod shape-determining protein MreC